MSRETEKVFKEFQKYLDEHAGKDVTDEEIERLLNEFMGRYNSNLPEPVTPETATSSDDYLELASLASSSRDALKYAKKALELDPYNFDAESIAIEMKANDATGLVQGYEKALRKATKHMEEEGYFEEEYIGNFWGVLETRPYMRLRSSYVRWMIMCGMYGHAKTECEELLRLCENDNMGMRYILMHLYAYFEEEASALALHRQYGSNDETEMLLPLSILYYKRGDYIKATRYLKRLAKVNKDLKRFLKLVQTGREEDFEGFEMDGGFRPDTMEELMVELHENDFLFTSADAYMQWADLQLRKAKK